MARLRRMEWGCGRATGGPDRAGTPVGDGGKNGGRPGNDGSVAGDCLLGVMAGKPTGRAGMFRRDPENRAGTFTRRSCRASGPAVGSSGGSGQAARACGAKRCGRWPVAHRTRRRQIQCRSVGGERPIRIGFALYYEWPACAKKSHKSAAAVAMPVTRGNEVPDWMAWRPRRTCSARQRPGKALRAQKQPAGSAQHAGAASPTPGIRGCCRGRR